MRLRKALDKIASGYWLPLHTLTTGSMVENAE